MPLADVLCSPSQRTHGTLFLDEVGDIRLELQPKLPRALQERASSDLGSTRTTKSTLGW